MQALLETMLEQQQSLEAEEQQQQQASVHGEQQLLQLATPGPGPSTGPVETEPSLGLWCVGARCAGLLGWCLLAWSGGSGMHACKSTPTVHMRSTVTTAILNSLHTVAYSLAVLLIFLVSLQ